MHHSGRRQSDSSRRGIQRCRAEAATAMNRPPAGSADPPCAAWSRARWAGWRKRRRAMRIGGIQRTHDYAPARREKPAKFSAKTPPDSVSPAQNGKTIRRERFCVRPRRSHPRRPRRSDTAEWAFPAASTCREKPWMAWTAASRNRVETELKRGQRSENLPAALRVLGRDRGGLRAGGWHDSMPRLRQAGRRAETP